MPRKRSKQMARRPSTLAILCAALFCPAGSPAAKAGAGASAVEEIYVLRSLRETRVAPTGFCAKLEMPTSEDNYSFHTPAVSAENGLITNLKAKAVGNIHGCFGKSADAGVFKFYGEFEVNGITGKANGDCRSGKPDFPEAGLRTFACFFEISELPAPYVGGQLSTNSVNSKNITGDASDPDGYTQVSIATIRLWKARPR